jgi:hypothetical protein
MKNWLRGDNHKLLTDIMLVRAIQLLAFPKLEKVSADGHFVYIELM